MLALKDLQVRDGAIVDRNIDSDAPTTRTVNGLVDPVLRVRTNQTQLLRLANISADIWYRLRLDGARIRRHRRGRQPGRPGVDGPRAGAAAGQALRRAGPLAAPGDLPAADPALQHRPRRRHLPRAAAGHRARRGHAGRRRALAALAGPAAAAFSDDRVRRVRHLTFSENDAGTKFFINGHQFDSTRVDQVVKLGTTEEWVIRNVTREQHPFHIHVNDFQVMSINGKPYRARSLQDTVPLPVGGVVRIRMRFRDFLGTYVYHCHILAHEDDGMMGVVDVTRTGRRPVRAHAPCAGGHGASDGDDCARRASAAVAAGIVSAPWIEGGRSTLASPMYFETGFPYLARRVEDNLATSGRDRVSLDELRVLAHEVLGEHEGDETADRFRGGTTSRRSNGRSWC